MDQKEKRKWDVEIGGRISTYQEMLHMNCETSEEIQTTIGSVITKDVNSKLAIIDFHEEFEQAQK